MKVGEHAEVGTLVVVGEHAVVSELAKVTEHAEVRTLAKVADGMKSFAQAVGIVLMAEFAWMQFSGDRALTLHDAITSGVVPAFAVIIGMQ